MPSLLTMEMDSMLVVVNCLFEIKAKARLQDQAMPKNDKTTYHLQLNSCFRAKIRRIQ